MGVVNVGHAPGAISACRRLLLHAPTAFAPVPCATMLDLNELPAFRRQKEPIPATSRTLDAVEFGFSRLGVPWDHAPPDVLRPFIRRAADAVPAIAEEDVRNAHSSTPQHATQRPRRWAGLHLFRSSPQMRASGGATCDHLPP